MYSFQFSLITGLFLLTVSCGGSKEVNDSNGDQGAEKIDTYEVVVSFYSPGDGIDYETKSSFVKYLSNYSVPIDYIKSPWGREGEVDFCIHLDKLTEKERDAFIEEAKEIVSGSEKVNVYEDGVCRGR